MARKDLTKKPLVEAILEIKWHLNHPLGSPMSIPPSAPTLDPHYRLWLGRLFDRLQDDYPFHEQLPTANLPDEMVGQIVQHRFRAAQDDWPLVQVGPGVFTVNDTHRYTWSGFRDRTNDAIRRLFDAHPRVGDLRVQSLVLRYIDAVDFDYEEKNAFAFLQDKMRVGLSLPDSLFKDTGVSDSPRGFSWQATFRSSKPAGRLHVSFATGKKETRPAILWETTVQSTGEDLPSLPDGFPVWLDAAHEIADDWFFKLIEGELLRSFEDV